jgi:hypothetical protein
MKLYVETNWNSRATRFYLEDQQGRVKTFIGVKDGRLIEQQLNPMNAIDEPLFPLLEMGDYMAKEFIKSVVDYASGEGIKTENENLLKGKLEATERHLEDLRRQFDLLLNKIVK